MAASPQSQPDRKVAKVSMPWLEMAGPPTLIRLLGSLPAVMQRAITGCAVPDERTHGPYRPKPSPQRTVRPCACEQARAGDTAEVSKGFREDRCAPVGADSPYAGARFASHGMS